jgi:pimeloyl-ACP methyl ester carboxylesterase
MNPMWLLRRVARSCGPILIFFAVLLSFSHITLLRLLLPFRFIVAECLVAGGLASAAAWYLSRRSAVLGFMQSVLLLCAVGGLIFGILQYRAESLAYRQIVISFENEGAHLVGTLYIPNGPGPHAGIVIVHGSGRFPRCFYHMWADHFVRTGYAVLLYDKRGVGGSSGHYEGENNVSTANIELLASDASAALRTLAAYPGVRPNAVGFWGVSQAAWVIPRAAVLNGHAGFIIIVSGPTTTTGEQMEYSRITGEHDPGAGMTPQNAERLMSERPPTGFDPVPDLETLNIPGLWLQGDHDWRIPAIKSVCILERLIKESNRPYAYHIFPGAGHAIFLPRKKGERLIPELAPGYWQAMDDWLAHQTNRT